MASVNKVILIGNLGADPEMRSTASGQQVVTLRLATNERWTGKNGETNERTEWHRVIVWGKQAEICNEYLRKGRQVYIEGRIQTREWQDKEGQKRFTTEIVAQVVQMLGSRGEGGGGGGRGDESQAEGEYAGEQVASPDDDLPF